MSRFAVVPTHWLRHPALSSSEKLTLVVLASYADGEGYCWPSVAAVAEASGLSPRAVQYALRALEAIGAIRVEARVRELGGSTSNAYWLLGYERSVRESKPVELAPGEAAPPPPIGEGGVHQVHRGGAPRAPGGVHQVHPNNTNKNNTTEQNGRTEGGGDAALERDAHVAAFLDTVPPARRPSWRMLLNGWTEGMGYLSGRRADPQDIAAGLCEYLARVDAPDWAPKHVVRFVADAERRRLAAPAAVPGVVDLTGIRWEAA